MIARYLALIIVFMVGITSRTMSQKFVSYKEKSPGSEQSVEMVPVKGGTFLMGSPQDEEGRKEDEGPRHKIKVDNFWMGKYEITWQQYDQFVEEKIENVSTSKGAEVKVEADAVSLPTPPYIDMSFGMGREGYPAINMTQYAAIMYAKWLTAETGHFLPLTDRSGMGIRLPGRCFDPILLRQGS